MSNKPYRSNFDDAAMVNLLAGNLSNGGWQAADHQMDVIQSEWNELSEGVATRDIEETRDGIIDVLFTVYGLAHRLGMNADDDWDTMMTSQMSKFDVSEDDALETKEKYHRKGMATVTVDRFHPLTGERLYVTLSSKDQMDDKGRYCPKGKWLKSYKFLEPDYPALPDETLAKLEEAVETE